MEIGATNSGTMFHLCDMCSFLIDASVSCDECLCTRRGVFDPIKKIVCSPGDVPTELCPDFAPRALL